MGTLAEERYSVCLNHPEQQEIFKLETLLIEAGYPYFFNFWEDLRPVFGGGEDSDPESIDWDNYEFLIEVGVPGISIPPMISIRLSKEGNLLELWIMTAAEEPARAAGESHSELTAATAMEIIKNHFKTVQ